MCVHTVCILYRVGYKGPPGKWETAVTHKTVFITPALFLLREKDVRTFDVNLVFSYARRAAEQSPDL